MVMTNICLLGFNKSATKLMSLTYILNLLCCLNISQVIIKYNLLLNKQKSFYGVRDIIVYHFLRLNIQEWTANQAKRVCVGDLDTNKRF